MTEVVSSNTPGLSRIHDSILKSGKSVHVLPGDEVILHPKKGFMVMNRRYTPWEPVDTPDPFFNLPADGYNSGRFVIGLANKRERERRFNAFAAGPATPSTPSQPPAAVFANPLPDPPMITSPTKLDVAPSEESAAPPGAPPPASRTRSKADRRPADGSGGVAKRKKKRPDAATGDGGRDRRGGRRQD